MINRINSTKRFRRTNDRERNHLGFSINDDHRSSGVREDWSAVAGAEADGDASPRLGIKGEEGLEPILVEDVLNLEAILIPTAQLRSEDVDRPSSPAEEVDFHLRCLVLVAGARIGVRLRRRLFERLDRFARLVFLHFLLGLSSSEKGQRSAGEGNRGGEVENVFSGASRPVWILIYNPPSDSSMNRFVDVGSIYFIWPA